MHLSRRDFNKLSLTSAASLLIPDICESNDDSVETLIYKNLVSKSKKLSELDLTSRYKGGNDVVFEYLRAIHEYIEYHVTKQYPHFTVIPLGSRPTYKNVRTSSELIIGDCSNVLFSEMTTENLVGMVEKSLEFFIKDKISRYSNINPNTHYYISESLSVWEDNNLFKQRKFGFYYWMEVGHITST